MKDSIKELRRNHWYQLIMDQRGSGLSITEFCKQHDLNRRQYHYWMKQFVSTGLLDLKTGAECTDIHNAPVQVFAEVPIPLQMQEEQLPLVMEKDLQKCDSGIMITFQDLQIHMSDTFNERALLKVLQVIRNA